MQLTHQHFIDVRTLVRAFITGAAAALTLAAAPALVLADQPASTCNCDQYKSFEAFSSLGDELSTIGTRAIHPGEGSVLENGQAELAALKLRITSNALIPDECKARLLKDLYRVHVAAFARIIAGPGSLPAQGPFSSDVAVNLYTTYGSAYDTYAASSIDRQCLLTPTSACVQSAESSAWAQFGQVLATNPGQVGLGSASASDLQIIGAYHAVLSSGSESAMLAYIKAGKDGLSNAQFITLVQMVGQRLGDDYDFSRNGSGPTSQGIVTGDQLLQAAASDTEYGSQLKAGVCRDIATLQAKMLETRGFPNSYVLTYGLPGDFHAIAIAGDPSSPTTFHTFDYGLGGPTSGLDGPIALFQRSSVAGVGVPDAALNYYIVKPEGAIVSTVPSEMSKFLQEAAGFDIRQVDPLGRETSSLLGAGVTFSTSDGHVSATTRVVAGQDGLGSQYIGGAETVSYGQGSNTPGHVGVFVGQQIRPAGIYGTTGDEKAAIVYLQADQHVIAPKVKINPNTTLTVDNSITVSGALGDITQGAGPNGSYANGVFEGQSQGLPFFGGDLRLKSEGRIDQTLDDGRLHSSYRLGVEVSPGVQDVRDGSFTDPSVVLNSVYAGTTQTLRVKDMTLFGDATVAVDLLGSRGIAEVGVAGSKWAASAYVAGRLTNTTAIYEDNTLRRVGLSATYRPFKQLQLGVAGEMPVEGDAILPQTHLMGTAIVTF